MGLAIYYLSLYGWIWTISFGLVGLGVYLFVSRKTTSFTAESQEADSTP